MNQQSSEIDITLRHVREYVAAAIALLIVGGAVVAVTVAFTFTDNAERFSRAKDIIQSIIPLLTFVLGYYFSKTSAEARAENAEATSRNATTNAQEATQACNSALAEASKSKAEADLAISTLKDVGQIAEGLALDKGTDEYGVLSGDDNRKESTQELRLKFLYAWSQAKKRLAIE